MSEVVDFKKKKDLKKIAVMVEELEAAILLMDTSIRGLNLFMKYIPVMEATSSLLNNKTLLEIHLNKYKRMLKNENKLEDPKK